MKAFPTTNRLDENPDLKHPASLSPPCPGTQPGWALRTQIGLFPLPDTEIGPDELRAALIVELDSSF